MQKTYTYIRMLQEVLLSITLKAFYTSNAHSAFDKPRTLVYS